MTWLVEYFDVLSETGRAFTRGESVAPHSWWFSVLQYAAFVGGILAQPYVENFQRSRRWRGPGFAGWMLFSLIIGFMLFPAVYKNSMDPNSPLLVQLAVVFSGGFGWQSLFATAKAATGGRPASTPAQPERQPSLRDGTG